MSDYGIIYIVKNTYYGKNIFKVGKSSRTLDERLKELSSDTSVLGKFEACAIFFVEDIHTAEIKCHKALNNYRLQSNREFFEVNYAKLLDIVKKQIEEFYIQEKIILKVEKEDEELLLKENEENKLKIEQERIKKQEQIEAKNLNLESIFNQSSIDKDNSIEKEKRDNEKEAQKRLDRVNKFKPIFDSKMDELKKLIEKIPFINTYKYAPDYYSRKYSYGYVFILSKKNSPKIQESINYNTEFDKLVQLYIDGLPVPENLEHLLKNQRGRERLPVKGFKDWQVFPPERKRISYDVSNSEYDFEHKASDDIKCIAIVFNGNDGVISLVEYTEDENKYTKAKHWAKSAIRGREGFKNFGNFFTQITKKLAEFQVEQNKLESNYSQVKFTDIRDPKEDKLI